MRHREKPLAEIVLRKYEKPFRLEGRELIKKLCLSLGLLQPGDTRDVIVDVFTVLLNAEKNLTREEIERRTQENRQKHSIKETGITSSNIRRQLRRLNNLFLTERKGTTYQLTESAALHDIFTERIEKFYVPTIMSRIKEYCEAVEKLRGAK